MQQYQAYLSKSTDTDQITFDWYEMNVYTTSVRTHTRTITKNYSFSSQYQPKNNKCYCYPYNYLYVTNNNGASNIYKYEDFFDTDCNFEVQYIMCMGGQVRLVPKNYKESVQTYNLYNYDESIPLTKYPTYSWSSDAYTNWLTQNDINLKTEILNIPMQGLNGAMSMGSTTGSPVGAGAGALLSSASAIMDLYNKFYQAELMPNITGGNNTGDLCNVNGSQTFTFKLMRSKNEYLEQIDSYFNRVGYKVNVIKQPNITGRTYWNYIEIAPTEEIGYGEVPSISMQTINNACRKGVTIWHDHTNLGNFSLTNSIVT